MNAKLREVINANAFVHGVGVEGAACTVAAINQALTGKVNDSRPDCMCPVLHAFVIPLQDAMPVEMLNSPEWREIAYRLAGSKADEAVEAQRVTAILDWMWADVLPAAQPVADSNGFGEEWRAMLVARTTVAGRAAERAAAHVVLETAAAWAVEASQAAETAVCAARAAETAVCAARAAVAAEEAVRAARMTTRAAQMAAWAAERAAWAAEATRSARTWLVPEEASFWIAANPVGLMNRLLKIGGAA